jgi:hypothetical protein
MLLACPGEAVMDIQYDEPKGGGLYIIWLSETHYYGGRTTSFKRRWRGHLQHLLAGDHGNAHMQNVFNKHGVFRPEVLKHLKKSAQVEVEQEWLDANFRKTGCVNLSPHATGGNVVEWTPEMRQKLSDALTGHTHSDETRQRMSETRSTRSSPYQSDVSERQCTKASTASMSSSLRGVRGTTGGQHSQGAACGVGSVAPTRSVRSSMKDPISQEGPTFPLPSEFLAMTASSRSASGCSISSIPM